MIRSIITAAIMLVGLVIMSSSAQNSKQIAITGKIQNADSMGLKGALVVISIGMGRGGDPSVINGPDIPSVIDGPDGGDGPGTPTGDTLYTDTLGNFTLLKDSASIANIPIMWFVTLSGYDSKNGMVMPSESDTFSIGVVTLNVAGTSMRLTRVSGVVVDSTHNPVSGALVTLTSGGGFGSMRMEDSVLTNASGVFFDSLLLDTTNMEGVMISWKVTAKDYSSREGRADLTSDTVILDTIQLKKPTTPLLTIVSGVIVDDSGAPIISAAIEISSDMLNRNPPAHIIYSKADGTFSDSIIVDTTYGLQLQIMWTVSISGYANNTGMTQIVDSITSLDTLVMNKSSSAIRIMSPDVLKAKTKADAIRITSLNGRLLWQGTPDALTGILAGRLFIGHQPVMIIYLNKRTVLRAVLKQIEK